MRELMTHLFLPHHTNNHKPKILHHDALILTIVFFLFLSLFFKTIHKLRPDILGIAQDITIERLYALTNQKRQENGFSSLSLDPQLSQAAAGKANDMFANSYWAHYSPSGKTPWEFIVGSGYNYVYAGENLAKDFGNSDGAVNAWMVSPTHRENILRSEYKDVGFAVVNGRLNGEETTLVVQLFGAKKTELASSQKPVVVSQEAAFLLPPTVTPEIETPTAIPTIKIPTQAPEITPTPALAMAVRETKPPETSKDNLKIGGVSYRPFFDIFRTTKELSLVFLVVLIFVLIIDTLYIWHKKIFRISGENLAHLVFLLALIMMVLLTGNGAII